MEQNKNRYELILGFVTLIISFSAFKDELKMIEIDIGFYKFTLADYLLKIVFGFGLCIYLYIIERLSRQYKKLTTWKIIDYVEKIAFVFFVFLLLSPILIILIYLGLLIVDNYTKLNSEQGIVSKAILSFVLGIVSSIISGFVTKKYFRSKIISRQEELEKEEIAELETAKELYEKKFYSQAILEAFKVLELHLTKLLTQKRINIPKNQFTFIDLFNYAIKLELIDKNDIATINEIRLMRNTAAHLDKKHTENQATKAIEFIQYLIQKTSDYDSSKK